MSGLPSLLGGAVLAAARLPALVLALAWSAAIAVTVVLVPAHAIAAAVALALVLPGLAVAVLVRPAIVALALVAALLGVARAELPVADAYALARAAAVAGAQAVVAGTVADDSRPAGGGAEVLVEPAQVLVGGAPVADLGNIVVRWRGPAVVSFGDRVQAAGKLTLPRDLPTFDRRAYLAQRGAYLELQATSLDVTGGGSGLLHLAAAIRAWYSGALEAALPEPHSGVLLGVVLGIRRGIPPDLQNALVATGLVHLLVLSGLKVAVFARLVQGALRPVLGRFASWPALCLIGMYALAGGATPAAVRASVMGGLAIAASSMGRPTHVWTSLAVTAAAMLGWRPELAWDVGFQLSFAGTAAIILLTPAIERRLPWMPQFVREPFAVTCAAQVGTVPMMAADFHLLSPVGPIANAAVLPVLPAMIVAGLALGALAVMPELARAAAIPVAGLLAYLEQVAFLLARLPAASLPVPRFPAWAGLAYYSAIGPAIARSHATGAGRKVALAAAVVAPLAISCVAMVVWAEAAPQASVLAIGNGQAVLIQGPHGAVLIDAGPSPTRLQDELGRLLPPWEQRLDALVITSPGQGHVGGLAGFSRRAATVVIPGVAVPGTTWRTAAVEEAARGAQITAALAGQVIEVAGFRLEVVAPEAGAPGELAGAADLGLRVVAPSGRSFCDFSDLDADAQSIAASRMRGPCTYLLLPNRGQSLLSPELGLAAGSPELVASLASGRLALGTPPTVLRTDQEGTITMAM